jgi:cytochrome P450
MAEQARALTIELSQGLRPRGGCDFVTDFARIMPVVMFLGIVDLPLDRREEFVEWGVGFVGATDQEGRDRNLAPAIAYLREVIDQRHANPGEDLLSKIAAWRDNPRFDGEDEVIGMAVLIFLGGLDTVANLLSFTALHLAEHPEHRRRLRADPAIIPQAAEEYIRRFGLSNTGRLITQDVTRKGVTMKADEMVLVPIGAASVDEREYPDPFTVDFDRVQTLHHNEPSHNTFGHGPHKCVGRPLARVELRIFLEEWLRLIPDFRLDPHHRPVTRMGGVNGVETLRLTWDV